MLNISQSYVSVPAFNRYSNCSALPRPCLKKQTSEPEKDVGQGRGEKRVILGEKKPNSDDLVQFSG